MMSFCKKSVHSFLSFSNSKDNETFDQYPRHHRNISSPAGDLSFFSSVSRDIQQPTKVVESAVHKSPPSSPPTGGTDGVAAKKRDPGGIGFIDDVGGSDSLGLMSCTESLGFESSDERRVDDQVENMQNDELCSRTTSMAMSRRKKKEVAKKSEGKKFPPPLSSLDHNGKPTFFLRPVRKDGRLEIKEVKIESQKIFHSSREDGRLRLHLIIRDDEDIDIDHEKQAAIKEADQQEIHQEEEKSEERVEEWQFPVPSGGGRDGFRRCHELMSHSHHHNLHVWGQHCVTTG